MEHYYPRSVNSLEQIVRDTAAFFSANQIDSGLRTAVDLATEELFVNMVTYNRGTQREIRISMQPLGKGVEVSLTDFDVDRFDPTLSDPVDVAAPLAEREPRGLGIFLVLQVVDSIRYRYSDRESCITFTKGDA